MSCSKSFCCIYRVQTTRHRHHRVIRKLPVEVVGCQQQAAREFSRTAGARCAVGSCEAGAKGLGVAVAQINRCGCCHGADAGYAHLGQGAQFCRWAHAVLVGVLPDAQWVICTGLTKQTFKSGLNG